MGFLIFVVFIVALAILGAIVGVRRTVKCPKCAEKTTSAQMKCGNCGHVGFKGKVIPGSLGGTKAQVEWTCPACRAPSTVILCTKCGTNLGHLFRR
jgi:hypothetical protein